PAPAGCAGAPACGNQDRHDRGLAVRGRPRAGGGGERMDLAVAGAGGFPADDAALGLAWPAARRGHRAGTVGKGVVALPRGMTWLRGKSGCAAHLRMRDAGRMSHSAALEFYFPLTPSFFSLRHSETRSMPRIFAASVRLPPAT